MVAPTMTPARPPPPPAAPEDKPRAYAARIDDDAVADADDADADDDGFGGKYLPLVALAGVRAGWTGTKVFVFCITASDLNSLAYNGLCTITCDV
jgi:hypothetical protein